MKKLGLSYDEALFEKVAKGLGPSLYNRDASRVSSSDKAELDTVKKSFLIGKLGLQDGAHLDEGIKKVINTMGKSNSNKQRAIFYYLLIEHFGTESK